MFGNRSMPEIRIMSFDWVIEEAVIGGCVRDRLAHDDGERFALNEVAAELGIDVDG